MTATTAAEAAAAPAVPAGPGRGSRAEVFRGDIEGLRAVAVGLVLLYHAGLPVVPGGFVGVDVFFVISGFLITSLLVRELRETGTVSLARFYARRAKRLLPATGVVLVATAVMVLAFVPRIRWADIGGDLVAAALYGVNWRFAQRSVDYLAEDVEPSPVQHFWSLAVEEQFYLVWPLLVLAVGWWVRRTGRSVAGSLAAGLAVIAVPSFLWSAYWTATEPASAFFVTTTRMWELAVGAAVAVAAAPLAAVRRRVALVLGWAGVAAIVIAGVLVTTAVPWPGYAAALPTLGTAAVIAAGPAAGPRGPALVLDTAGFRWVGALSYSLYLWHWPLIVVATAALGGLSPMSGLVLALLSVLPAWLTYRLVENPFRHSVTASRSPKFALSVGANFTLLGVVAGLVLLLAVQAGTRATVPDGQAPGAAALDAEGERAARSAEDERAGAPVDRVDSITPDPLLATKDVPSMYDEGCQVSQTDSEPVPCAYGPEAADVTIAAVGDSKIAQWVPALEILARERGWRVVTYTKSACPFADAAISMRGQPYISCTEWNARVMELLTGQDAPDIVLTSQRSRSALAPAGAEGSGAEVMAAGLARRWTALEEAGVDVVVLADNPAPPLQVYECVAENREALSRCAFPRAEGLASSAAPVQMAAAERAGNVDVIDLTDAICPEPQCAPVIGEVLVYRQGSHLTKTYIETLAPLLGERLITFLS